MGVGVGVGVVVVVDVAVGVQIQPGGQAQADRRTGPQGLRRTGVRVAGHRDDRPELFDHVVHVAPEHGRALGGPALQVHHEIGGQAHATGGHGHGGSTTICFRFSERVK